MKNFRRILALVLCLALAFSVTACSTGGSSSSSSSGGSASGSDSGSTVELTFWGGLTGDDAKAMQGMVDDFNSSQSDIHVTWFTVSWSEVFSKFETSFNTDAAPDVMLMHVTDIPNYASRDMITPLADVAKACNISESDYSKPVWNGAFYDGTQYAIPWDYHELAVYVNNTLFKNAGLDPTKAFTSEDEFFSACEALKASGTTPVSLGVTHGHTGRFWYSLLYQYGGSFCDDSFTKAEFNSDAGVKAMTFLNKIIENGYAPAGETDIDGDWLGGTTAMNFEGPWFTPTAVAAGMDFSILPFPQIGETQAIWGSSHTLTVPKYDGRSAEKTDAINVFLAWMIEHSYTWGEKSGQIPANNTVSSSKEYTSCDIYKYQKTFIDTSEYVHYEPLCPADAEFGFDNSISPILTAVSNVLSGNGSDIQTELKTAEDAVNSIFKEYSNK